MDPHASERETESFIEEGQRPWSVARVDGSEGNRWQGNSGKGQKRNPGIEAILWLLVMRQERQQLSVVATMAEGSFLAHGGYDDSVTPREN